MVSILGKIFANAIIVKAEDLIVNDILIFYNEKYEYIVESKEISGDSVVIVAKRDKGGSGTFYYGVGQDISIRRLRKLSWYKV